MNNNMNSAMKTVGVSLAVGTSAKRGSLWSKVFPRNQALKTWRAYTLRSVPRPSAPEKHDVRRRYVRKNGGNHTDGSSVSPSVLHSNPV